MDVCSQVHFDESCYTLNADNGNKVLSKSAIPTLFPHKQKRTEHSIRPPNKRSREIEETEQTESVASATAPEDEEVLMLKAKLARLEGRMRQVSTCLLYKPVALNVILYDSRLHHREAIAEAVE